MGQWWHCYLYYRYHLWSVSSPPPINVHIVIYCPWVPFLNELCSTECEFSLYMPSAISWTLDVLNGLTIFLFMLCIFSAFSSLKRRLLLHLQSCRWTVCDEIQPVTCAPLRLWCALLVLWPRNPGQGVAEGGELLHAFFKQKSIAVAYFGLTYLYNWCIPDLSVSGESYLSAGLCKR